MSVKLYRPDPSSLGSTPFMLRNYCKVWPLSPIDRLSSLHFENRFVSLLIISILSLPCLFYNKFCYIFELDFLDLDFDERIRIIIK